MGQFSWFYADTGKQMRDNYRHNSYLLVPPPFQSSYGKYILEESYGGYGIMGGRDVYELVTIWNKSYIPEYLKNVGKDSFAQRYVPAMEAYVEDKPLPKGSELRDIGIALACYDEDNARLPYPIKIVESVCDYDKVGPSPSDPNQGWYSEEDEEDEWW